MATVNYGFHFDGVSMHWKLADDASHDYATGDAFTFGLWFNRDYDDDSAFTRSYLWSRENQHECYIHNNEIVYYINLATTAVTWNTGVKVGQRERTHLLVITGEEAAGTTTLNLYLDGKLKATKVCAANAMPADVATELFFMIDYGTTAGYYFKGSMTGWFQSNDTAITAANVLTIWNDGVYDIDTTEAIAGLDDSIGMEENTGTTYDNALNAGIDGAGQNTPVWVTYLDCGRAAHAGALHLRTVGQCTHEGLVIKRIMWEGEDIADGDELELTNWHDKIIFHAWSRTADTGDDVDFVPPLLTQGVKTTILGHGTVHLYLE